MHAHTHDAGEMCWTNYMGTRVSLLPLVVTSQLHMINDYTCDNGRVGESAGVKVGINLHSIWYALKTNVCFTYVRYALFIILGEEIKNIVHGYIIAQNLLILSSTIYYLLFDGFYSSFWHKRGSKCNQSIYKIKQDILLTQLYGLNCLRTCCKDLSCI